MERAQSNAHHLPEGCTLGGGAVVPATTRLGEESAPICVQLSWLCGATHRGRHLDANALAARKFGSVSAYATCLRIGTALATVPGRCVDAAAVRVAVDKFGTFAYLVGGGSAPRWWDSPPPATVRLRESARASRYRREIHQLLRPHVERMFVVVALVAAT